MPDESTAPPVSGNDVEIVEARRARADIGPCSFHSCEWRADFVVEFRIHGHHTRVFPCVLHAAPLIDPARL